MSTLPTTLPSLPAPAPRSPPAPTVATSTSALREALGSQLARLQTEIASKSVVASKASAVAAAAGKVHAAAAAAHQEIVELHGAAQKAFESATSEDRDSAVIKIARLEREVAISARAIAPLTEARSTSASIAASASASLDDAKSQAEAARRNLSCLEGASLETLDAHMAQAWATYLMACQALVAVGQRITQIYKGHVARVAEYNLATQPAIPLRAADGARAALALVTAFADRGVVLDDQYLSAAQNALTGKSPFGGPPIVDEPGKLADVVAQALARPDPGAGVGLDDRRAFLDAFKDVPLVHQAIELARHRKEAARRQAAGEDAPPLVAVGGILTDGIRRPTGGKSGP